MKKKSRKLYRRTLDKAVLGPVLAELPGVGDTASPLEVIGWATWEGVLMRARAVYPDGLQVEIYLTQPKAGKQSMSSYNLTYKTRIGVSVSK